jgi:hypothetical protein
MSFTSSDFKLVFSTETQIPSFINLYDKVYTTIHKDKFMYIIFSNSRICLINSIDYSLLHLYDGIDEEIKKIEYTESCIYILAQNDSLYTANYTNLEYKLVNTDISMFSTDKYDNLLLLDLSGRLIYNGKVLEDLQFNINYIKLIDEEIFLIKENKLIYKNESINLYKFLFGSGDILVTIKGIYDLNQKTFYKIKNIEEAKKENGEIYLRKAGKYFKLCNK